MQRGEESVRYFLRCFIIASIAISLLQDVSLFLAPPAPPQDAPASTNSEIQKEQSIPTHIIPPTHTTHPTRSTQPSPKKSSSKQ